MDIPPTTLIKRVASMDGQHEVWCFLIKECQQPEAFQFLRNQKSLFLAKYITFSNVGNSCILTEGM